MIQGILIGFFFGFLLQKGRVAQFNVIVRQFLLKDFTVFKIMLSAIIVGGIVMYAMVDIGVLPQLPLRASGMVTSAVGGIIFGIGMTIVGYCPGTAIAALGQGAFDALAAIIGMLIGAFVILHGGPIDFHDTPTQATLASIVGVNHWIIFGLLILCSVPLFYMLNKLEKK